MTNTAMALDESSRYRARWVVPLRFVAHRPEGGRVTNDAAIVATVLGQRFSQVVVHVDLEWRSDPNFEGRLESETTIVDEFTTHDDDRLRHRLQKRDAVLHKS